MSSINDEQISITLEDMEHLSIDDIALLQINAQQALQISKKSSDAGKIYNIWVRKLLRALNLSELKNEDWHQILEYLEQVLNEFVQNLLTSKVEEKLKQLLEWWTDTHELLKWMQSIVDNMDVRILAMILTFGFQVVIKTFKFMDKGNLQHIKTIQQQLLHLLKNHLLKIDLQSVDDFKGLDKLITSLCDVGSIMSSLDFQLYVETWRLAAKIFDKSNESHNEMDDESKEIIKALRRNWSEKLIVGMTKDLKKLFKYFQEDVCALQETALNNVLKVAQFYLKHIGIIMKNIVTFPAVKEYCEAYTTFVHQLKNKRSSKLIDATQKYLNEILINIHQSSSIDKFVCQHLTDDNNKFESCDLFLEYMTICFDKDRKHLPDIRILNEIFDILFDGPLIFIDNDKYAKVLRHYVTLTFEDNSSKLHMIWCQNVIESASWIKAYASCEILLIYYGRLFKASNDKVKSCLEFWLKCWRKFSIPQTTSNTFQHQRFLIEMILKRIVSQLPQHLIEECFDSSTNSEIILLKCGKDSVKRIWNLNANLRNNLKKIEEKSLVRKDYTELLHLLDIWYCQPQYVNVDAVIKDALMKAFLTICSLTLLEMKEFRAFLNKSFGIFKLLRDVQMDDMLLKCLRDNLNKTKSIIDAFMLDYLLELKPQSDQLLEKLQTPEITKVLTFLIDGKSKGNPCTTKDFKIFQSIYNKSMNKSNQSNQSMEHNAVHHHNKRLRFKDSFCDSSSSTDHKFILNSMLEHSHQLLNITATVFDNKDCELLNCIKHNLEQCLINKKP